jgi:hypothetical protein
VYAPILYCNSILLFLTSYFLGICSHEFVLPLYILLFITDMFHIQMYCWIYGILTDLHLHLPYDLKIKRYFLYGKEVLICLQFNLLKPSGNFTYHQV